MPSKKSSQSPSPRRPKRAVPRDQKSRGEWVELLFMTNVARFGLKVAKIHGDSSPVDAFVYARSTFHGVQVKSTLYECRSRPGFYVCHRIWGTPRNIWRYSREHIDFIAAYVVPEDIWFIIPVTELTATAIHLPGRESLAASRWGRFFEAWHLLGAGQPGLTIQAAADLFVDPQ